MDRGYIESAEQSRTAEQNKMTVKQDRTRLVSAEQDLYWHNRFLLETAEYEIRRFLPFCSALPIQYTHGSYNVAKGRQMDCLT